ncbi:bifunctional folylpolyglutamate synthase/dihydrofolate synthase [Pseudoclavibacter endophyticus]|uniref:tetrahydrofolate synthase n=1 Tax=Pseudoclavibacter endophyticus TaxID=1778590 RepID=A0A6H9WNZ4_9MICO|nr:bifunctional folylpolyglutamate synthase/dihydrofolate synthase [Pseudoclavibacter endophyticus]
MRERTDWRDEADRVMDELMERVGEAQPEPRLGPTRRAAELLGDVHRSAPVVHLTGTNGKTSTARITAALLGAHGLRVGLMTSPHLERLNERIEIEGEPISDERLAVNWGDIQPVLTIVDAELEAAGEVRLTFFEALTVLAFACFTDAPVDVVVLEVGMGGEWDSTNVADGDVAVFTPIALDHASRLGSTIAEIARTKAGIIKPAARVVTAIQAPEALAEIAAACALRDATLAVEGSEFELVSDTPEGPAARDIVVRARSGTYEGVLPLRGAYQAHNASLAIAAVEAFFGGEQQLRAEVVQQGLAAVTSPGRLQRIGHRPAVFIDAAHNPHGALALAEAAPHAMGRRIIVVLGVLDDKDYPGVIRALAPIAAGFIATRSESPRAVDAEVLAERIAELTGHEPDAFDRLEEALEHARDLVSGDEGGAVLVTGSVTMLGDAIRLAREEGWGATGTDLA